MLISSIFLVFNTLSSTPSKWPHINATDFSFDKSSLDETFENGLLEYPQYTKPQIWEEKSVPDVLLSGDHSKIKDWRLSQSEASD